MSAEKRPNSLITAIRNTLLSQVFRLLFVAAGGAGAVTAVLGYLQEWPLAQIFTFAMVSAAAGAALIGYARRAFIDADLRNKFYIHDVQVVEEPGESGELIGYIPWVLFHNLSDIPLHYKVEELSGHLNRFALYDLVKKPVMCVGHIQAKQEGWHALGLVSMSIPDGTRVQGAVKLRVGFGKTENHTFDYRAEFELHLLIDEAGVVQLTRAFKR